VGQEQRPDTDGKRAMIVLGLSASLIAGMTLFSVALLSRMDCSRDKVLLRVL
jgi:hypothetical protein